MRAIYILILITVFAAVSACGSNSGDPESPLRESKSSAPQLLTPGDHAGGYGWDNENCFLCHPVKQLNDIHDYSDSLGASFSKIDADDIGGCLYCHGSNGIENVTAETYDCMVCHENSSIVDTYGMFAGTHQHDVDGSGEMDSADCVVCHSFSDMNGEIELAIDFTKSGTDYADTSDFCLTCHDGNGAFGVMPPALAFEQTETNIYSTYKGTGATAGTQMLTADIHGIKNGDNVGFGELRGDYEPGTEVACLDCHQVHASANPYLITETGSSAELTDDTAQAASVSVTENNFTELCAVCHTNENGAPTDNGLNEVVHTSTYSGTCTNCHYHGAGFGTDNADLF